MKILVVAPRNGVKIFPVGLGYVIAVLKKAGHEVSCVNLNLTPEFTLEPGSYDVVATGGLACHYHDIEKILVQARQAGVPTVIGGGIVSSEPELMVTALTPDYAVLGEGEEAICELLDCLQKGGEPSSVQGIAFLRHGEFVQTPSRKPIKDLDALPFPDYEALGFAQHLDGLKPSDIYYLDYFDEPRAYPIASSRSCPFDCTFCYHPLGKVYRERSIESILAEIREVVPKYRINILEIVDELFAVNRERLVRFCTELNEFRRTLGWELKWGCQLRVTDIDSEVLEILRNAGCYSLSLGLESYSATVLDSMKKKITPEQIHTAVDCVLKTDLRLQGNFLFGDKAETAQTAAETLSFWKEHAEAGILLTYVQPYPDCDLYRYCQEQGIITDRLDFIKHHVFDLFNMTQMPEEEFFRLRLEVLRCDQRYSPHAVPQKAEGDILTVTCPHCRKSLTYRNFQVVEKGAQLFSLKQNELFFSKMMYCRECGRRFWARSLAAQIFTFLVTTLLKFPRLAIKVMDVRNRLFALYHGGLSALPRGGSPLAVLNRLRNG